MNNEFTCGADALRAQLSPQRTGLDAAADIQYQPSLEASAHDLANKVSHTPEMRVVHQGPPPESSVPVAQLSNMSRLLAGSEGAASCNKSGDDNQVLLNSCLSAIRTAKLHNSTCNREF